MTTYSDETLRAYLLGALPAADSAELEAELLRAPKLERRLMALDTVGQRVGAALRQIPEPARLQDTIALLQTPATAAEPVRRRAMPWLSVAAALAVGLGVGWFAHPGAPEMNWRMEVARYQALYTPQTVAHLSGDTEALTMQLQRASAAVDLELSLDRLAAIDGMELRRAQVLGYNGKTLVQIAYRTADGTPIALCVIGSSAQAPGAEQLAGLAAYSWTHGGHQLLLIGGTDTARIAALAQAVQSRAFPAI